ncbi:hypothetical protein HDU91_002435, partial [Kappamyces sp. JEL0680]
PSVLHPVRVAKNEAFLQSWREAFSSLLRAKTALETVSHPPSERPHWTVIRDASSLHDLAPEYRNALTKMLTAIAYSADNVLEDEERYRRAARLQRKIPVVLLVSSLRVINPAPFVARFLPLFLVKIPGFGVSLCQIIGSSIVGFSHTRSQRKELEGLIPLARREAIEKICAAGALNVKSTPLEIKRALLGGGLHEVAIPDIGYARFTVRLAEKQSFIAYLGSPRVVNSKFFRFLAKFLPPLMREWSRIGSLADIVSEFFSLLDSGMAILGRNFSRSPPPKSELVEQLVARIEKFVAVFFVAVKKIAKRVGTSKQLPILTWLLDMLFVGILEYPQIPATLAAFHDDIKSRTKALTVQEQAQLQGHLNDIRAMAEKGMDERFWPQHPLVDDLVPAANGKLKDFVLGLDVLDVVAECHQVPELAAVVEV